MEAIVFLNILAAFFRPAVSDHVTNTWTKFASLDGFLASTGTMKTARSHVHCGIQCSNVDIGCKSFFFTSKEQLVSNCHLQDDIFLSSSGMTRTPNMEYFIPANYSVPTLPTQTSVSTSSSQCHPKDDQYHTVTLTDSSTFTFKFHATPLIYEEAMSTCTSESSNLVKITTSAKLQMLREILLCEGFTSSNYVYVDGVYDAGTWYFNNGDIAAFPAYFWGMGFPNDEENHKCTQLVNYSDWYGENWHCSDYGDPFICEK